MKNCCVLNVFYGLPDDYSLRIETSSNVEWNLVNCVVFHWSVFIVILHEYCNTEGWLRL